MADQLPAADSAPATSSSSSTAGNDASSTAGDNPSSTAGDDPSSAATALTKIEALLARRGLTRSELARRLDVSPAYVTKLLRPGSNPTLATLDRLAQALGARFEVHLAAESPGKDRVERGEAAASAADAKPRGPRSRSNRPSGAASPTPPADDDETWRVW
jgi:transcriptional regulator with XRE-family HTH domain